MAKNIHVQRTDIRQFIFPFGFFLPPHTTVGSERGRKDAHSYARVLMSYNPKQKVTRNNFPKHTDDDDDDDDARCHEPFSLSFPSFIYERRSQEVVKIYRLVPWITHRTRVDPCSGGQKLNSSKMCIKSLPRHKRARGDKRYTIPTRFLFPMPFRLIWRIYCLF